MNVHDLLTYFGPVFLVLIIGEIIIGRSRGTKLYSWSESLSTIAIATVQRLVSLLPIGAAAFVTVPLFNHFRLLELSPSAWWYWPVLFVAFEFSYYWFHRLSHEIRWFWATHSVHHSITEMNVLAAYRFGWTEWLSMATIVFAPLGLIGFDPANIAIVFAGNLMYQAWLHTTVISKLGPLEGILNTPSAHRVHHARNADYLDRNHGGVLMIFDRMFGTYVEEREAEPVDYGLVKPVGSANPIRVAFHEWMNMIDDLKRWPLRHWPMLMFGPPGWSPDGSRQTSAEMRDAYRQSQQINHSETIAEQVPAE